MFLLKTSGDVSPGAIALSPSRAAAVGVGGGSPGGGTGARLRFLVTGANGFLGRYVVAEALARGHSVRALIRSPADGAKNGWDQNPSVEIVQGDLRRRKGLAEIVAGVDVVLHLAAAKSGDLYAQYGGTVVATENLLSAMSEAGVKRIVSISSFSVYAYSRIRTLSTVDETSPIEVDAFERDEYAHTKLVQERLVRTHATSNHWAFCILRPGVIYGPDNLWSARLGVRGKRVWIRIGAWAQVPLTYVENCAQAIVLAAEKVDREGNGQTLNVVDDAKPPTQRRYVAMLRKRMSPRPMIVRVPWTLMRTIAGSAMAFNRIVLRGRAKMPGILIPARLDARGKPLRYSNALIRRLLGWEPRFTVSQALDRSLAADATVTAAKEKPWAFKSVMVRPVCR